MSLKPGTVVIDWADGKYPVRLGIGELQELERKTNTGTLELYRRVSAEKWRINDLREILRNGLIGGGMPLLEVNGMIARYFDSMVVGLVTHVEPAMAVLMLALVRPPAPGDEELKKEEAMKMNDPSTLSPSTKMGPLSDMAPERLMT